MKIKVTENVTEIEADAKELRESNTLAGSMERFLSRIFQPRELVGDEPEDETDEQEVQE